MINHRTIISIITIVWFSINTPVGGEDGFVRLDVVVSGATPSKGNIMLALFDSQENFLKAPVDSNSAPVDSVGQALFEGIKLPSGIYALSVYHDEDSNGELNTGLFGIPTELVGFSNNVKGLFGPPKFRKAAVTISEDAVISIELSKAKD